MIATKRLTTRRGSTSASDPWAKHPVESERESSCRLSILRVGSPPSIQLKQPPPTRLSFASSFKKDRGTSPRRAIPIVSHNMSPDELVQLARANTISSPPRDPTFTPLPDDILLPFIDRPSEVATLIASPPSARLFALLQLTFNADTHTGSEDPVKWSYTQLHDWLTATNRDTVPDSLWVARARRCIVAHSETIWERVKGALGVPYELDVEYDAVDGEPSNDAAPTSNVDEDGGVAHGHWDDWDAVIDSPVDGKRSPSTSSLSDRAPSPLIIEPILSSPATSPFFTPSSASSTGLGGITEEEESQTSSTPAVEEGLLPSQIHGIRISTSPTPTSPVQSPILRPGMGMDTRRLSFGSNRSSNYSPQMHISTGRRSRPASISSFSSLNLGSLASSVEERSSPLFPSSFAALKPKMAAR